MEITGQTRDAAHAWQRARKKRDGHLLSAMGPASTGSRIGNDGRRMPMVKWNLTEENDTIAPYPDEDVAPEELDFSRRVSENILREMKLPYDAVLHEYRSIEEEFVARAGDNKEVALDLKRRISMQILGAVCRTEQPQDVCRAIWDELLERGFADHETKQIHTGIYARCCQYNGEFSMGIAALDLIIAETEHMLEGTSLTPHQRKWYEKNMAVDRKIRDELKAGIRK